MKQITGNKYTLRKGISMQRGYTFIELLVVFSIMGIVGVIGMASFVGFNNNQIVESATSEVSNSLTIARQRALSQIKPPTCTSAQVLRGYRVFITVVTRTYRVEALCGTQVIPISTKQLPAQISFDTSTPTSILFVVPNGTASPPGTITLNGYGKTKQIIVDSSGTISQL